MIPPFSKNSLSHKLLEKPWNVPVNYRKFRWYFFNEKNLQITSNRNFTTKAFPSRIDNASIINKIFNGIEDEYSGKKKQKRIEEAEEECDRFRDMKAHLMKIQYLFPFFQLGLMKINYIRSSINPDSSLLRELLSFGFFPCFFSQLFSFV